MRVRGNLSKSNKGDKGDTPSIEFRINENGELEYRSNGILLDREYIGTQKIMEQILKLQERIDSLITRKVKINLLASEWKDVGDEEYSQVVSIKNTTANSQVDLQITNEQLAIFREKGISLWTENENGVVTVFCIGQQKPTNDYTIQATVMEVEVDEG